VVWFVLETVEALDVYGAKFGKAVAKIADDLDEVLRFYEYPAEHWIHLRTTNPIESTFATVRNRSKITKGPGVQGCRHRHGVQTHRGSTRPVAGRQRTAPRRPRARRRHLQARQARRTNEQRNGACSAGGLIMKPEFLTVYDYQTGGVWVYLRADSAAQIHERFPELRVVKARPSWLTDEEDRRLREEMTIDIDDMSNPFLNVLLQQRN
jgi:hypothetical protein